MMIDSREKAVPAQPDQRIDEAGALVGGVQLGRAASLIDVEDVQIAVLVAAQGGEVFGVAAPGDGGDGEAVLGDDGDRRVGQRLRSGREDQDSGIVSCLGRRSAAGT